jgi:apolipoprotein N-acyltransferase
MTLVQQNVDSWLSGNEWPSIEAAQDLTRAALAEREAPPDLIAWSETILRRPFPQNRATFESRPSGDPFVSFVRSLPAPLLTGAPSIQSVDPFEPVNSAIMLDPKGRHYGFYGKRHLVPMAENIPFWEVPLMRAFFQNVVGVVGVWTPGDRYAVFSMPFQGNGEADARPGGSSGGRRDDSEDSAAAGTDPWQGAGVTSEPADAEEHKFLRFGTPICYEDSFGYLCREFARLDADVLINLTNNSWSQTRSAQIQHFVSARYRAVENRMALVRSTNSGYTAIVDATGAVIADVPMFEQAYLNVDVPIYENAGKTVYTQLGDFFARGCILISVIVLVGLFVRDRRRL